MINFGKPSWVQTIFTTRHLWAIILVWIFLFFVPLSNEPNFTKMMMFRWFRKGRGRGAEKLWVIWYENQKYQKPSKLSISWFSYQMVKNTNLLNMLCFVMNWIMWLSTLCLRPGAEGRVRKRSASHYKITVLMQSMYLHCCKWRSLFCFHFPWSNSFFHSSRDDQVPENCRPSRGTAGRKVTVRKSPVAKEQ